MTTVSILEFGADCSQRSNTQQIQTAIDTASRLGGGTVVVPAGRYQTGPLFLKSNIELHLCSGAVLSFSNDPADYPVVTSRWEGVQQSVYASCIYAEAAENISVTGMGMLDGQGEKWWQLFKEKSPELAYPRPKLISFHHCCKVKIQNISLKAAPSWTIHPIKCENVMISGVTIKNPPDSPNTDGIDPESCTGVRISDCHIDVGDDCIAIKAGTEEMNDQGSCENITITNCTMVHGHGGVVLGSEMSGSIRNVVISNCVFQKTDRGIRLKSRRGRGGTIEDIRISNLVMDHVNCPFILNLYYFWGPKGNEQRVWDKRPYPLDESTPVFRRIHFQNITARNVHASAGFLFGLAEQFLEDITFHSIDISMAETAVPAIPAMMSEMEPVAKQGFYVAFSRRIYFEHVTITGYEGPAFILEGTEAVEISACRGDHKPITEKQIRKTTDFFSIGEID
ncbi:glycoside hydrolase family 28 protein [Enterococcus sp. DIV0187]|uniref:glycoside hydrolase family 28 protein n=1 Tax=Enterococcus sp. DIV0187 TaxID=2774644 RepID=UPI003F23195B